MFKLGKHGSKYIPIISKSKLKDIIILYEWIFNFVKLN